MNNLGMIKVYLKPGEKKRSLFKGNTKGPEELFFLADIDLQTDLTPPVGIDLFPVLVPLPHELRFDEAI